mmetsp:Transcript_3762/g.5838  ORF Transcript_3762/g.5838 Transcript_3762/m.5838 type:complete len:240 (-) Transcript_3762:151-870(-)
MSKVKGFGRTAASTQDPTKVPKGIDTSTYFAPSIPDEVKQTIPLLHITPSEVLSDTLSKVVLMVNGEPVSDESLVILQRGASKIEGMDYGLLFTGLYSIIRIAIRQKAKSASIHSDLLKMNCPAPAADEIVRVIQTSRTSMESSALCHRIRFPRLEKLRWRVDVIISSGSLSRVLRPVVLMQMVLSNSVIKTFEVSIDQFNQLRYGVAKVLNDMQTLERHPIMRIVNEFERRDKEERSK